MKESFGEDSSWIFEGYEGENNIFPASYIVTLTDLSYTKEVENAIVKMDNVNKITSSNETIDTLIKIANGVKIAVSVIFVLLLIMAITIIANTIKLTVHSRRKEISIMKYVGATNGFIRGPFIVEGIIIGVVSAGLTLLVLATVYDVVIGKIAQSSVLQTMGLSLLKFSEMVQVIGIIFLGLGIGIGIIGSLISMKKYLEV
jgi:cell division transport system permease protein